MLREISSWRKSAERKKREDEPLTMCRYMHVCVCVCVCVSDLLMDCVKEGSLSGGGLR